MEDNEGRIKDGKKKLKMWNDGMRLECRGPSGGMWSAPNGSLNHRGGMLMERVERSGGKKWTNMGEHSGGMWIRLYSTCLKTDSRWSRNE